MMRPSILLLSAIALGPAAEPPPAPPAVITIPAAERVAADALLACTLDGHELAPHAATTIGAATHQGAPTFVGWFRSAEADHVSATWATPQGTHQRSVLHIKPSYLVVLDHVYAGGNRTLARSIHLPGVPTVAEATATVTGTPAWLAHLVDGTNWDAGVNGPRSIRPDRAVHRHIDTDTIPGCAVSAGPVTSAQGPLSARRAAAMAAGVMAARSCFRPRRCRSSVGVTSAR